jgi:hypothetical protein
LKDSFIANGRNTRGVGVKNLSTFLSTLNSKKFSVINVWMDGSWSVTNRDNIIKFADDPIFSLNIDYCQTLTKPNLNSLADTINSDLKLLQKKISD